jgi:hypothetical protein
MMMGKSFKLFGSSVLALALLIGAHVQADHTGNGGFLVSVSVIGHSSTEQGFVDIEVYCNPGYTCGLASFEVNWDDGSATDSYVDYVHGLNDPQVFEHEFIHYYGQKGLFHVQMEVDDDQGNWWALTRDIRLE